jgi:hypothetical protein
VRAVLPSSSPNMSKRHGPPEWVTTTLDGWTAKTREPSMLEPSRYSIVFPSFVPAIAAKDQSGSPGLITEATSRNLPAQVGVGLLGSQSSTG